MSTTRAAPQGQQLKQQKKTKETGKSEEMKIPEEQKQGSSSSSQQLSEQKGSGILAQRGDKGTLSVRDIFDKELMQVGSSDIDKQHVGWLRERMLDQMEQVRGLNKNLGKDEELYVYSTFGSWYGDQTPLKEVKGDLRFFRRGPQEGSYEMSVHLPDRREVKVNVNDDSTVADVKEQVAQHTSPRIPPWNQILSFQRRALLDDFATLGALRLPMGGAFDLLW